MSLCELDEMMAEGEILWLMAFFHTTYDTRSQSIVVLFQEEKEEEEETTTCCVVLSFKGQITWNNRKDPSLLLGCARRLTCLTS